MKNIKKDILWELFKSSLKISACTFGGGFVIISFMKKRFVEELKWFGEDEMLDIAAISQTAPGPNPINASVIVGYKMHGILGSFIAVLGMSIPPMIVISIISLFYNEFRSNEVVAIALQVMRAGVAAVIIDVAIDLTKNVCDTKRILYISSMIIAFIAAFFFNINAIVIVVICLVIGILDLCFSYRKKEVESC